jgi:DNA mismatch repair protein MutS2
MALLDPVPSPVEHADLTALEWEPLLALLAGFASSAPGRSFLLALRPSASDRWIVRQHQLVAELRLLLSEQASIPLGGLFDPTQLAAKAQIPGAALEADELQAIARLANDIAAWQALMRTPPARVADRLSGLAELSATLTTNLKPLAESIERKIMPDGTLADDASPELNRIRREQERRTAPPLRRRLHAGRPDHHSRRPFRHSRPRRTEAQGLRRRSRRQLLRANGLRGTAGNHRAEQRTGPPL